MFTDMKIEKNKVVALSYELTVEGVVADKAGKDKPLEYIHGNGMLLPRFEEEVAGKEVGETFEFTLTPEEGYGLHSDEYLIELPKEAFCTDGKIREDLFVEGTVVPMMSQSGEIMQGIVHEVKDKSIVMDFNHPMAGKTLHFTGSVVGVREATEDELANGLHKCRCHKGDGCDCGNDCNCGDDRGCDGNCDCKKED